MYGEFDASISYGYKKYTYKEAGVSHKVHIFKTNPNTMGIAGAVSAQKKSLYNLEPNTNVCASNEILAKTNGNYLDPEGGKSFYGIFYSGGIFSYDGQVNISPDDASLKDSMYNDNYYRVAPSFGINTRTGAASIRWPNCYAGNLTLTPREMTQQFDVIIAGQHCLVHNGKSVFESVCYSWEGIRIADWSNLENRYNHHNEKLGSKNSLLRRARTFFGHSPDGACYMVCVEGDKDYGTTSATGMTLKDGARLMCDLGCDYAMNMDGGSPTQMRVKGQGMVYSRLSGGYDVGSAICAYQK